MNSDSSLFVSTKYMTVVCVTCMTCVTVLLSSILAAYVTQTITLCELCFYGYFKLSINI